MVREKKYSNLFQTRNSRFYALSKARYSVGCDFFFIASDEVVFIKGARCINFSIPRFDTTKFRVTVE